MSRTIAILGLTQVIVVILGFFGLGIVMKMNGYPHGDYGIRWSSLALFLRQQGLYLLLTPLIWVLLAATSQNRQRFIFTPNGWAVLGVIIITVISIIFLYACIFPYTRPIFIIGH